MKLFMFAASLQTKSVNKQLIQLATKLMQELNHQVDLADFHEFDLPLYDADIQNNQGIPKAATHFVERMHGADGLIISVPEYNFSVPGTLKNLIDWVSRINPMPWRNQCIQLLSASPSLVGGNRGLWHTRTALECCGSLVYPEMFSLASAHEAFNNEGNLNNSISQKRLTDMLKDYLTLLEKLR